MFGHKPHELKPGQNVLVWGASGGLGVFGIQLAAAAGGSPPPDVEHEPVPRDPRAMPGPSGKHEPAPRAPPRSAVVHLLLVRPATSRPSVVDDGSTTASDRIDRPPNTARGPMEPMRAVDVVIARAAMRERILSTAIVSADQNLKFWDPRRLG